MILMISSFGRLDSDAMVVVGSKQGADYFGATKVFLANPTNGVI
jgi:hypothetical protein